MPRRGRRRRAPILARARRGIRSDRTSLSHLELKEESQLVGEEKRDSCLVLNVVSEIIERERFSQHLFSSHVFHHVNLH